MFIESRLARFGWQWRTIVDCTVYLVTCNYFPFYCFIFFFKIKKPVIVA